MMNLTFVSPKSQDDFDHWIKKSHPDIMIEDRQVLDDRAVRWMMKETLSKNVLDQIRIEFKIDVFQTNDTPIKLLMADMDSTIVSGETLDDMAQLVGVGKKVADITARAMRGELDFEAALNERVGLLKGMPADIINQALSLMTLNNGARELLSHLKSKGVYCVLISGGFTQFTSYVAHDLGFDAHFGNELILSSSSFDTRSLSSTGSIGGSFQSTDPLAKPKNDGIFITGKVQRPILDKNFKLQKLNDLKSQMNLNNDEIMAIGDGANDLPMLSTAGVGIAYHGKPLLNDAMINRIDYTDLSSLIYIT